MATSLRSFRPDDAEAVVGLSRQAYAHPEEQVANPTWTTVGDLTRETADWDPAAADTLLVVEDDGDVVGFGGVEARLGFEQADLFGPLVARRAQRRRLGARLLAESVTLARRHGAHVVGAGVGTRNRRGRVLLERNAFRARGGAQAYYELRPEEHRPHTGPATSIRVRRGTQEDLERVLEIYRECFPDAGFPPSAWEAYLAAGTLYVAERAGRVIGLLSVDRADRWIYTVGVTAGERSGGVGATLLSEALRDYWREHPGEALGLSVAADNTSAVRLYRRQGFRPALVYQAYELAL